VNYPITPVQTFEHFGLGAIEILMLMAVCAALLPRIGT
jgi:hypothetical protein